MKVSKKQIIILGAIALLLIAALPVYYDSDDAYRKVADRHGIDVFQRIKAGAPECADDGVGTGYVPFGTSVSYCGAYWFVLFNTFPFQVSGNKIAVVE